jgi:hypothetical protein
VGVVEDHIQLFLKFHPSKSTQVAVKYFIDPVALSSCDIQLPLAIVEIIPKKSEKNKLSNKKVGHTKKKLNHNALEHI